MQKTAERIIEELANKYKLPKEVIVAAVESQFKCARKEIGTATEGKEDTFINVRFKNLGIMYADHNKIKAIEYARGHRGSKVDKASGDEQRPQSEEDD